jgi:uracil-DNA glycosylase family 4
MQKDNLATLINEAKHCSFCSEFLPQPPRPVFSAGYSKLVLIGQAPGQQAHNNSKPFSDQSGVRLRRWLKIDEATFYNPDKLTIMPMGVCFPGYKNGADAPPRKECAPKWHHQFLSIIKPQAIILVGRYAQKYYLPQFKSLSEAMTQCDFSEGLIPLPHPSGRNNRWLAKHPWFESEYLPKAAAYIKRSL